MEETTKSSVRIAQDQMKMEEPTSLVYLFFPQPRLIQSHAYMCLMKPNGSQIKRGTYGQKEQKQPNFHIHLSDYHIGQKKNGSFDN